MAKIIQINDHNVIVGMDDGSTIEANRNDFNCNIYETMIVDTYKYNDKYLFTAHTSKRTNGNRSTLEPEPDVPGKLYINKLLYGLLCILFGMLGVHYFYAKKYGSGFLCIGILIGIMVIQSIFSILAESLQYNIHNINLQFLLVCIYQIIMIIKGVIILRQPANKNGNILINK